MQRRFFIKGISLLAGSSAISPSFSQSPETPRKNIDRKFWVDTLTKISFPVLEALSKDKLKLTMPVECAAGRLEDRKRVTYLEALGRTLAGLAPWLELGYDGTQEGKLRKQYIDLAVTSISNAVNPAAKDFMNFTMDRQPLVDTAFLAHALLRAPKQLWGNLNESTRTNLIAAFKSSRVIKPYYSNWLLFTAMVEAALLKFTGECDEVRMDYAIKEHENWYKGDGVYGDGPDFHFDYYNSFVIQPMMLDVVSTLNEVKRDSGELLQKLITRSQRYAEIQERMISPEGTYPVVGRSLAYRCGAFQLLAQMSLQNSLPKSITHGQVKSALSAVIEKTMYAPNTFDSNGWLSIGLGGHQPTVGETYISTGSLYLCSVAFLPLGLPPEHEFWRSPFTEWTNLKAFSGKDFPIDKALGH